MIRPRRWLFAVLGLGLLALVSYLAWPGQGPELGNDPRWLGSVARGAVRYGVSYDDLVKRFRFDPGDSRTSGGIFAPGDYRTSKGIATAEPHYWFQEILIELKTCDDLSGVDLYTWRSDWEVLVVAVRPDKGVVWASLSARPLPPRPRSLWQRVKAIFDG
jgi:hypothetical protein